MGMIEINTMYRIVNSSGGNNGKIVTVIGYAGLPGLDGCDVLGWYGNRFFVDRYLPTNYGDEVNHLGERQLQPVDDGYRKVSWERSLQLFVMRLRPTEKTP